MISSDYYLTWLINSLLSSIVHPHRGGYDKEEDGTDDDETNRDSGQATDRVGGWKSGRGLWTDGVHQHDRGCGEAGDQYDGGESIKGGIH